MYVKFIFGIFSCSIVFSCRFVVGGRERQVVHCNGKQCYYTLKITILCHDVEVILYSLQQNDMILKLLSVIRYRT